MFGLRIKKLSVMPAIKCHVYMTKSRVFKSSTAGIIVLGKDSWSPQLVTFYFRNIKKILLMAAKPWNCIHTRRSP